MNVFQTKLQTARFSFSGCLTKPLKGMAGAAGFEPATYGFGDRRLLR